MERKIQQIFLDKEYNYIYIVDSENILYLYESNQYYPFLAVMDNVKDCFMVDGFFFVHHAKTITIFDQELTKTESVNTNWITKNIDYVCYNKLRNIIVTLENGEIYVNKNIGIEDSLDDIIQRISLSHKYKYVNNELILTGYYNYEEIKITDNFLLAFNDGVMDIFDLNKNNIEYVASLDIDINIYQEICEFDKLNNMFNLLSGDKISLTGNIYIQNYTHQTTNNPIFYEQGIYFLAKNKYVLCHNKKIKYESIIKPLLFILPTIKINITEVSVDQQLITIILPKNMKFNIISNKISQIMMLNDKYYKIQDNLPEILFLDDLVYYDKIISYGTEKTETTLIIDIETSKSIISQLVNIIPQIYRLNNEMMYKFEQIDSHSNVVSYGEGVTRQIFNVLRIEIDNIFEKKFDLYESKDVFNIGKLMYFCNKDGNETFFNIHPYFFYSLSKKSDHHILLKKFKSDNYEMYHKQYTQYLTDPTILAEIDSEIKNANDYIKYLFTCDLSEKQICMYDNLVRGFCSYSNKNKYYHLVKKLPITYYINQLINTSFFDIELDFSVKNDSVNKNYFYTFREIFQSIFNKLSKNEIIVFAQNITGSQYYSGKINIVFAYKSKELITQQTVYNEGIIDEDDQLYQPLEINNVIIDLNIDDENIDSENINDENIDFDKLSYQISTCNTELIVNIFPNEENINNIIKLLTLEDLTMKN